MKMRFGHAQVRTDAIETKFAVGAFEAERMFRADRFVLLDPFVHAPEVSAFEVELEVVDEAGHERKLFGGSDRSADATRIVRSRTAPCLDVFDRFGQIEFFKCVIEHDAETG